MVRGQSAEPHLAHLKRPLSGAGSATLWLLFPAGDVRAGMAAAPPSLPTWVVRLGKSKRIPGKPRPVKLPRALVLADQVSNRRLKLGEASCVTEMALMMACWKENEFRDSACAQEVKTFLECSSKAEAMRKKKIEEESLGRLDSNQVNRLLRRFPNITDDY